MRFTLKIDCDGDSFADHPAAEVARLLDKAAAAVRDDDSSGVTMDANGNTCGGWEFLASGAAEGGWYR